MKDWIVDVVQKSGGIKGLRDAYDYMKDSNRPSHSNTEITEIGNTKAFQNTVLEFESLEQKGRKTKNLATSAMLSLPNDLRHPTVEEWSKIANKLLENYVDEVNALQERKLKAVKSDKEIIEVLQKDRQKNKLEFFSDDEINKKLDRKRKDEAKFLHQKLDLETVKNTTGLIIHYEKGGKSSHLNVLISNVQNGENKKVITQYGGLNALKKAYNKAVLDVLKLDNQFYTPENSRLRNQAAYDNENPFYRKEYAPEFVKNDNKKSPKVRKKRRRKVPFYVAQAKKKEDERIQIINEQKRIEEENEILKTKEKEQKNKEKDFRDKRNEQVLLINKAKEKVKIDRELLKKDQYESDREMGLKEFHLNSRNKDLEEKEVKIEKKLETFNSLVEKVTENIQKWFTAIQQKKKGNKIKEEAKRSAETLHEVEAVIPEFAKKLKENIIDLELDENLKKELKISTQLKRKSDLRRN